jgi:hypothetical protein
MFADPQVITVNAVPQSMPRVLTDGSSSVYQTADMLFKLTLSHTPTKDRIRTLARLDTRDIVADPLTSINDWESLGLYIVVDRPIYGITLTQIQQRAAGLLAWYTSANIAKLFGGES